MNYKKLHDEYNTVLKLDLDDTNKIPYFTKISLIQLSNYMTIKKIIIKKSPSKTGYHIIICLDETLTDSEIVLWQFALGSDIYRERHNWIRYITGNSMKDWNILFNNKVKRQIKFGKCHNKISFKNSEMVYTCCDDSPFLCPDCAIVHILKEVKYKE